MFAAVHTHRGVTGAVSIQLSYRQSHTELDLSFKNSAVMKSPASCEIHSLILRFISKKMSYQPKLTVKSVLFTHTNCKYDC